MYDPGVARLSIGQFAKRCRLSIKALRHYDRVGLLSPAHVDERSGYRYYDTSQSSRAVTIAMLRGLDVPLAAIRQLLDGAEIGATLEAERQRFERERQQKTMALRAIEQMIRAEALLPYDVRTRHEPARRMVSMTIETTYEWHVPDTTALVFRLFDALHAAGLPVEAPVMGRTRAEGDALQVAALAPLACDTAPDEASVEELAGGEVAWTVHRGAYEALGLAHHALHAWAQSHEREVRDDVLEIYLDDPRTVAPEALRTEVLLPLVTRKSAGA